MGFKMIVRFSIVFVWICQLCTSFSVTAQSQLFPSKAVPQVFFGQNVSQKKPTQKVLNSRAWQKESAERRFKTHDKVIGAMIGLPFGIFLGVVAGTLIDDDFEGGLTGATIGMMVGPFLTYEMMAHTKGAPPQTHWSVLSGANLALTGVPRMQRDLGVSFGLNRDYFLLKSLDLRLGLGFHTRRFSASRLNLLFITPISTEFHIRALNFEVSFIDVSPIFVSSVFRSNASEIRVLYGLSLSVVVQDRRQFHVLSRQEYDREEDEDLPIDYTLSTENTSSIFSYPNLEFGVEFSKRRFIAVTIFKWNFAKAELLSPIQETIRLNTIELGVGYKL